MLAAYSANRQTSQRIRMVHAIPDDKGHCPERTADGCMAA